MVFYSSFTFFICRCYVTQRKGSVIIELCIPPHSWSNFWFVFVFCYCIIYQIHFGIINTTIIDGKIHWIRQDEKADHRFQSFKKAGINKLANAPSDVSMQRGKTRFGMNKEHPSDLDSGNLTKTYPQNSLLLN